MPIAENNALRVLLIEDNPADADAVRFALQDVAAAWQFQHVQRLHDAIEALRREPGFDVALVDLNLPDAIGMQAIRALHEAAPRVRLVALTGLSRGSGMDAVEAGADDFLVKGEDGPEVLARAIRYAFERGRREENEREAAEQRAARRVAESAAEHSEAILRSIGEALIEYDRHAAVVRMNAAAEAALGASAAEFAATRSLEHRLARSSVQRPDGSVVPIEQTPVARALRGEQVRGVELKIERPNGDVVYVISNASPIRGREGDITGAIATFMDISEQKRAEIALRESDERLRTLADNIAPFAWMAGPDGAIFWCSQRWCEYTGASMDQLRDGGWEPFVHPEHRERVRRGIRACIESGEPWEDSFPLLGRNGASAWFLSRARPIRDDRGTVVRWVGTHTDVSELRAAQDALREEAQRKNDFLGMLGHELRNPLGPILNSVYILSRLADTAAPQVQRAASVIERQVVHMTRLLDDLLDVTRIARGKIRLQRGPCDVCALVERVVEDHRSTFAEKGVDLTFSKPAADCRVDGDATRIAQAVGNLLGNAAKFTPSGGRVEVSVSSRDDSVEVHVRDTGSGMTPETLKHVFEPFVQAERTLGQSVGGLGLGLALVRQLAELHGGSVDAASAGEGCGSEFTLRLPMGSRTRSDGGG